MCEDRRSATKSTKKFGRTLENALIGRSFPSCLLSEKMLAFQKGNQPIAKNDPCLHFKQRYANRCMVLPMRANVPLQVQASTYEPLLQKLLPLLRAQRDLGSLAGDPATTPARFGRISSSTSSSSFVGSSPSFASASSFELSSAEDAGEENASSER